VLSVDLPWWAWWAIGVLIVGTLGYFEITLTARTLGVALLFEVAILLVYDVAVLVNHGFHGFPLTVFAPATVFGTGAGVGMMYAFSSFVGFEASAIYGEEARDPKRAVARATYIALAVIGVFYTLTTWAAIGAYGAAHVKAAAVADPSGFLFASADRELGSFANDVMQILVVTSLFAGFLAFHQGAARYFFAVARDGLLPGALAHVHPRRGSPYLASLLQIAIVVVVVGALGMAGLDPYLHITAPILGLGTLGVIMLQAGASLSVVAFFRRRADRHWWSTLVAPALASAGLMGTVVLVCVNFGTLTGSSSTIVRLLPWIYLAAAIGGLGAVAWLRSTRPVQYEVMAANHGLCDPATEGVLT
jgi:amino acid transporter